jgi:hypothetical protein
MNSMPWSFDCGVSPPNPTLSDPACPSGALVEAPPADPMLVAAGWQPRFLADAARAVEAEALYRDLGFEVRAEPLRAAQLGAYCEGCRVAVCQSYTLLYTRRAKI